mmetsp:Transcript_35364/g.43228  ORF Transcript_35364/g.43228 Transcript_35364/m.43228 type:complete len:82 (-) Transcript_35364:392-637(-)
MQSIIFQFFACADDPDSAQFSADFCADGTEIDSFLSKHFLEIYANQNYIEFDEVEKADERTLKRHLDLFYSGGIIRKQSHV